MYGAALGIRGIKIHVTYENRIIKIKQIECIDKKARREINDILRIQDFYWIVVGGK